MIKSPMLGLLPKSRKAFRKLQRFGPISYKTLHPVREIDLGGLVALPDNHSPTNPGLMALGEQFLVSVRGVNYRLESDTSLRMIVPEGHDLHSANRFLTMREDGTLLRAHPQLDALFDEVEDIRLFSFKGCTMALGSVPFRSGRQLALFTLRDDLQGVADHCVLPSPFHLAVEKNWSPFEHLGELHFLYSIDPLIVLKYDVDGRRLSVVNVPAAVPADFYVMSGSTPGLPVQGGYLFIAHRRSVRLPGMDRVYVHHAVFLDNSLSRVRIGPAFVLGRSEIQFVAGMALMDGVMVLSYGKADRMARLACFDIGSVPAPCPIIPLGEAA